MVWESYDSSDVFLKDEDWEKTVFTNDFILRLLKSYVVDRPEEVLTVLDNWKKFLEAKKYLLKKNAENGYVIQKPEFFKGYFKEIKKGQKVPVADSDIIYSTDAYIWMKANIDESEERVLGHVVHDVSEKAFKEDKKSYLHKLNGLTKRAVKIVNPSVSPSEKNRDANLIFKFDDTRIDVAREELIPPQDKLDELDKKEEAEVKKIRNNNEKNFNEEVKTRLFEFESGELIRLLDDFKKEQLQPITQRMTRERLTKIDGDLKIVQDSANKAQKNLDGIVQKIREKHSGLKGEDLQKAVDADKTVISARDTVLKEQKKLNREQIEEKYNLKDMIADEIFRISQLEMKRLQEEKQRQLRQSLKPKYDEQFEQEQEDIKESIDNDREKAKAEGNIIRLHTYFEVPVEESSNSEQTLKEAKKSVEKHDNFFLVCDDTGDKVLLDRQKSALERFRKGYVMNPFLATALFCPDAGSRVSNSPIETFYQEHLNDRPKEAVAAAISSNGMYLIQGPPGTGKTQVIAEITTQLVLQGKKVLISSENNKAVDNAFSRLPKDPLIRPLRLVHDKKSKSNQYSIDYLLKNFYGNIAKTLNDRIGKYENIEQYNEKFEDKLKDLRLKFDKLRKIETEQKDTTEILNEKEQKLRDLDRSLAETRAENNKKLSEADDLKTQLSSVKDFQLSSDSEDNEFLKRVSSVLNSHGINPELDSVSKFAASICRMDESFIISQYSKMISHSEYFRLLDQKSAEKSPDKIVKLNHQILEYEGSYQISREDFPLFKLFNDFSLTADSLPADDLNLLKNKLENLRRSEIQTLEETIKRLEESVQDLRSHEFKRRNLSSEIEDLKEDEVYTEYRSFRDTLNSEVRKVFSDLNISGSFQKFEDAFDLIQERWRSVSRQSKKDEEKNKKLIPTYRGISKYLADESVLKKDNDQYTKLLESYVNVIGITCTSKDYIPGREIDINKMGIDVVIIDEVSKIPFVELLLPILYGKTVILVGDHKQLPPMYTSDVPEDADWEKYDADFITKESDASFKKMYEDSFFKNLFQKTPDSSKMMLDIQYRMHPQIMEVDNEFYFDSPLRFGGRAEDKEHYLEINGQRHKKIVRPENHVLFIDCKGKERKESGSTSYFNSEEADVVVKILELIGQNCRFDRNRQPLKDQSEYRADDLRLSIGVICTYAQQARSIQKRLRKTPKSSFNNSGDEKFMVKTVDDFQGDERDIIILSMVRTDSKARFLREYRRINVAMSRARRLLIIVGNESVLSKMNVEIDSASHSSPKTTKVYENIIQKIKKTNGYLSSEDVTGGN
ncbi:MAG: hypothetical protein LBU81_06235 [Methanosarcinales archaeon]|nr:hypothetical protein [Methanosarcinales archaeon]